MEGQLHSSEEVRRPDRTGGANVIISVCTLADQSAVEAFAKSDPATLDFPYLWRRYKNWEKPYTFPIIATFVDRIRGFHAAAFGKTYVNSYYQLTHPNVRGQGVGGAMVAKLIELAHERGCTRLKFKVPRISDGQRFWEGFGLRAFGEDSHHYLYDVSLEGVVVPADLADADRVIPPRYIAQYERFGAAITDPTVEE